MGLFTAMFGKSATSISEHERAIAAEQEEEYTDSVELSVPDLDLDNCSFEQYKEYKSSVALKDLIENGEQNVYSVGDKSYREFLEESYQHDVLKRGFLGLW